MRRRRRRVRRRRQQGPHPDLVPRLRSQGLAEAGTGSRRHQQAEVGGAAVR